METNNTNQQIKTEQLQSKRKISNTRHTEIINVSKIIIEKKEQQEKEQEQTNINNNKNTKHTNAEIT